MCLEEIGPRAQFMIIISVYVVNIIYVFISFFLGGGEGTCVTIHERESSLNEEEIGMCYEKYEESGDNFDLDLLIIWY